MRKISIGQNNVCRGMGGALERGAGVEAADMEIRGVKGSVFLSGFRVGKKDLGGVRAGWSNRRLGGSRWRGRWGRGRGTGACRRVWANRNVLFFQNIGERRVLAAGLINTHGELMPDIF